MESTCSIPSRLRAPNGQAACRKALRTAENTSARGSHDINLGYIGQSANYAMLGEGASSCCAQAKVLMAINVQQLPVEDLPNVVRLSICPEELTLLSR